MTVTALLVSHDGARWLPAVLEGLRRQTRRPDRVVAVDTGSTDASRDLLVANLGADSVIDAPAELSFPDAVALGLGQPPRTDADGGEWVWLLHDDSRPAPDALERLLAAAADNASAAILGPKIREWPSLRRLLEVGVTISGTGRRETGLERGEYDQGQHDQVREVLAVSSAGMLVRREVLEQLGLDRRLPVFGNDLDLGWRAARAGHRTLVVPDAVVFHAEAAHRGLRRTSLTGSPRRGERRAALYTLLANAALPALPFLVVRLFLGSLLRALGLLLVRAPREALDELLALLATYGRPDLVLRGRRERRRTATVPARDVRHLLAPSWLPYRHGLDAVSDLVLAVVGQVGEAPSGRRAARAAETGPVPEEAQELPADTGLLARFLASPRAWVAVLLVLLALVAARGLVGGGVLSGGALLPAPGSAAAWWALYLESWHEAGIGSDAPAAPYLLPMALGGTLLFNKAWLLVDLLFVLAVPLAAWGAGRFLRNLVGPGWPQLWGAVTYGLVPVLTGAVAQGRLGTVVAAAVLPWVAHAALFLGPGYRSERRWQAGWRTALLLALLTAFTPLAWPLAAVLAVAAVVAGVVGDRATWTTVTGWGPVAVAVLAVPVLLLPWSLLRFTGQHTGAWYAEAGLPAPELVADLGFWELLSGRATTADLGAAPAWFSIGVAVAAVAALVARRTRRLVVAGWLVIVLALGVAVVLDARGEWAGFPVLLAAGAAVTVVAAAGRGTTRRLSGRSFGWYQPLALLVVLAALLAPVAGLLWWVTGVPGPLDRAAANGVPAYMVDASLRDPDQGVLVVRRDGAGLGHTLLRGEGARLGDDSVQPSAGEQRELTELVAALATDATAEQVDRLSDFAVEFVYLPPPADPTLVANLDSVSGLSSASSLRPGSRAWQLDAEPTRDALPGPDMSWRPVLLGAQLLALVVAAVLAAPSRRVRR